MSEPRPWLDDGDVRLYHGDCLDVLRSLPDRSVHMCATSPPFYGLRDYGVQGQIGLEETPDQWVERLVAVFREVRRVLRDDGTLWVEIGDSYASGGHNGKDYVDGGKTQMALAGETYTKRPSWLKQKDLLGQPWLLAFALRADGWYLRSEIIWARPNPMPESVTDRPTKSHSTVFLLSKSARYFYDADAIRQPHNGPPPAHYGKRNQPKDRNAGPLVRVAEVAVGAAREYNPLGANARSVWNIPTEPTPFAHFATWPQALVRRMILAGTSEKGCCPECGAPWVRDVEKRKRFIVSEGGSHAAGTYRVRYADEEHATNFRERPGARDYNERRWHTVTDTVGWSPSCGHALKPVPCTVLDPFAGSATTCLVARNHGRHAVGIELNEAYLEIAAKRLQQLSLLTGTEA